MVLHPLVGWAWGLIGWSCYSPGPGFVRPSCSRCSNQKRATSKETPWTYSWTISKCWPLPSGYSSFSGWSCARYSGLTQVNEMPGGKPKNAKPNCGLKPKLPSAAVTMTLPSKSYSARNNRPTKPGYPQSQPLRLGGQERSVQRCPEATALSPGANGHISFAQQ